MRMFALFAALSLVLVLATSVSAQNEATHLITDANGDTFEVAAPFTVDTIPPTTTTTLPPTTTTTEPPPTTTTTPPTTTTQPPDRDRPGDGAGAFVIQLRGGEDDATRHWWDAPYHYDLFIEGRSEIEGVGWVDGDRAGYKCAYMFLDDGTGRFVGRVTFARVAGYASIFDRFMAEGQQTGLAYDGTPTWTDQSECENGLLPFDYEVANDVTDFRPPIFYVNQDGAQLEDRSYATTTGDAIELDALRFTEFERLTEPVLVDGEVLFYERVTVLAWFQLEDGTWGPSIAVYYDTLVPDVHLTSTVGDNNA